MSGGKIAARRAVAFGIAPLLSAVREALRLLTRSISHLERSPRGSTASRILAVIDDHVPDPTLGAGYPRARAIVEAAVAAGWYVKLIVTDAGRYEAASFALEIDLPLCVHRAIDPDALERVIRRLGRIDVAWVSRPSNLTKLMSSPSAWTALRNRAPIVYDAEAIVSEREAARRSVYPDEVHASDVRVDHQHEVAGASAADIVVAVSEADAETFRHGGAAGVKVLGHACTDQPSLKSFSEREGILFVGRLDGERRSSPNVDSICWFCEEVLPRLNLLLNHQVKVHVVGEVRSTEVKSLASSQVFLHGKVEMIDHHFDSCRHFIAPTRFSAGIPIKVLEAASRGLPCVTTSRVALQSGLPAPGALLVADTPDAFAENCRRLYSDPSLWTQIRDAALSSCKDVCAADVFKLRVNDILDTAASLRSACTERRAAV